MSSCETGTCIAPEWGLGDSLGANRPGAHQSVSQYLPILTFILLVLAFAAASFFASNLLGPKSPNAAKTAPYESGIVPETEPAKRFPVKFYLVALAFIVLDVEIVFLYPFATIYRDFEPAAFGLIAMGIFLIVLLIPFAYLLSSGALDWGPVRKVMRDLGPGVLRSRPGTEGLDPAGTYSGTGDEEAA